ncbi:MAG: serine protein kinase PrkA [Myxococcales bacterium]|nr:serine protein kinase PrkA [Myxococcales bacterium]
MRERIEQIASSIKRQFDAERPVLSFEEYLELFKENPWRHTRDAARYLRDCFDHAGSYAVKRPWGESRRFRLFDRTDGLEHDAIHHDLCLIGHEQVQDAFYRALSNFVREGRPNRLILLHGPNGSAKSTFASCVLRALERYSHSDEGPLYTFSWVFPGGQDGKTIGFSAKKLAHGGDSFAHLDEDQIEVKMRSELRESPLLLLPKAERQRLLIEFYDKEGIGEAPPEGLFDGELSHKNRQIFQALLTAYHGDLKRVLAHARIERFHISRRYRVGAVTVGPQMSVDAHERQISQDMSLNSLPASLSALTLYEAFGDLVDASGGILEYSDLLKRPLEAWKYLLLAIEDGQVPLAMSNLSLNSVFIASSNELHLAAFREHHEYNSFRARINPIRMPYLLDYVQEQEIYDTQIVPHLSCPPAPHATMVAALWAVLTRLRHAQRDSFENPALGQLAAELTPLEKADLYAEGRVPERLSREDAALLRAGIGTLWKEADAHAHYEGLTGASPRELRTLLLDAAQRPGSDHLSPVAVLEQIEALCIRSDYPFLKETAEAAYHDHRGFIATVRQRWLEKVDDELRMCTGLVRQQQHVEVFDRYVTHVSNWLKNEKVYSRATGRYDLPDEEFMKGIEATLGIDTDSRGFRRSLISKIGAHALDNPGKPVDYEAVFPQPIQRLRQAYYQERQGQIRQIAEDMLALVSFEGATLEGTREPQARKTLAAMKTACGYSDASLRVALSELVKL